MKRLLILSAMILGMTIGCESALGDDADAVDRDVQGEITTQDNAPTDQGNGGADEGGGGGDCTQYCTDMIAACPEDDTMDTCMHSCEGAEVDPSQTALECAAAATDCQSARPCWAAFFS
jgi:hypothetical protein